MLLHQLIYQGDINHTALFEKQDSVTYGQLQTQVELFRDFFYSQGIRPGDHVGLFSKNSLEFVYSYFAIVSLGAIVIPFNFQLITREISYIVNDAGIRFMVTMEPLTIESADSESQQVKQLIIPEFAPKLARDNLPPAPLSDAVDADQVCVIIYTSGTTGFPKGAMLTHANLISNAKAISEVLLITPKENFLCVLPMYHALSWTCTVVLPLLYGASITIMENFSIRETLTVIQSMNITVVFGIPAMYQLVNAWGSPQQLEKVRLFISGGAPLPKEILREFYEKIGRNIAEGYGLSEASPVVSVNPPDKIKAGSIGKPLPGIKVMIRNSEGNAAMAGEIGEITVQGPNVMQGYYNLPAETRQALRDGWLHTGDMAYMDQDGYVYIVDRLKDMIITGGENVYPREIEELLYAHPDISEAAVIGVPDPLRGEAIHAYIVPVKGANVHIKDLRSYLQAQLALYKVPRKFIQIKELPRNSTGKILKRLLLLK